MKISYALYQLPWFPLTSGALIRVSEGNQYGYADLHPLLAFGDQPVQAHLQSLKSEKPTFLIQKTYDFACKDLAARKVKKKLITEKIEQNFLVSQATSELQIEEAYGKGFRVFKLKCGVDAQTQTRQYQWLARYLDIKIRLDFNSRTTATEFQEQILLLKLDERLEYIEDPCQYEHELWKKLRQNFKLALDFEYDRARTSSEHPECDVVIYKPARQNQHQMIQDVLRWGASLTVTSVMDHPVGMAHAYAENCELVDKSNLRLNVGGCTTWPLTIENQWIKDFFLADQGIGFSHILESMTWSEL